ncbi:MAG: hypothetical protein ACXVJG_04270, partial [Mucilaginibacter sp.]
MLKRIYLLAILAATFHYSSVAQNSVLDVGARLQKAVNLYYENGIAVSYSDKSRGVVTPPRLRDLRVVHVPRQRHGFARHGSAGRVG